jgi:hypothetical protein
MKLEMQTMHRVLAMSLMGAIVLMPGCGSHEVTMPRVTEESLSPEQKAQYERMQNAQAEVMRKAGVQTPVMMTPQEYAQQQFEAQKKAQEEAKDNGEEAAPAAAEGAASQ